MKKNENINFLEKYKGQFRVVEILLIALILIFIILVGRKIAIISSLSNQANQTINNALSSNNYYVIIYYHSRDSYSKIEYYFMDDKVRTGITTYNEKQGLGIDKTYGIITSKDEYNNYSVLENDYIKINNEKYEKRPQIPGTISNILVNKLQTDNWFNLVTSAINTKIKKTTFNGEECYYIYNFKNDKIDDMKTGLYVSLKTGMILAEESHEKEYKYVYEEKRTSFVEYEYGFNSVSNDDFKEPNEEECKN